MRRPPAIHAPFVLLGWAIASVGLQRLHPIPILLGPTGSVLAPVVSLLGGALWLWTAWEQHRHGTSLDPATPARALVTSGPYRYSRNPAYLGVVMILSGVLLTTGTFWGLALLPVAILVLDRWTIRAEEAALFDLFDEEYRRYTATVRRWLGRRQA